MIKFTVWDKNLECFRDGTLAFGYDDFEWVLLNESNEQIVSNYSGEIFNYIGKTDIEGKKIYADSSIVEYDSRLHGKQRGYFSYNRRDLRYELTLFNGMKVSYAWKREWNLKIIGTLQEDKHLLDTK